MNYHRQKVEDLTCLCTTDLNAAVLALGDAAKRSFEDCGETLLLKWPKFEKILEKPVRVKLMKGFQTKRMLQALDRNDQKSDQALPAMGPPKMDQPMMDPPM